LEALVTEIEHIMEKVQESVLNRDHDKINKSVTKELKALMLKFMRDPRPESEVMVSELKSTDFNKMKELVPEEKAHLNNMQKILKLYTSPKPTDEDGYRNWANKILEALGKELLQAQIEIERSRLHDDSNAVEESDAGYGTLDP